MKVTSTDQTGVAALRQNGADLATLTNLHTQTGDRILLDAIRVEP
jgi:hypothetical protein